VIDGEADSNYEFHGLGSIVRKSRIDFGVDIQISGHEIQPHGVTKIRNASPEAPVTLSDRIGNSNYTLGLVKYPQLNNETPATEGLMIYVKASLVAEDALHIADIRQYSETHPTFPHETTGDQFFSESQFESYRQLGQSVMSRVISEVLLKQQTGNTSTRDGEEDRRGQPVEANDDRTPPTETVTSGENPEETESIAKRATAYVKERFDYADLKQSIKALNPSSPTQQAASLDPGKEDAKTDDTPTTALEKRQDKLAKLVENFRAHCHKFSCPVPKTNAVAAEDSDSK
jgi:hypothetical protein